MGHDNLKGVNYIEKNGLERVASIDVLLVMQMLAGINFTVLQPHFPHAGPTHPVGPEFTLVRTAFMTLRRSLFRPCIDLHDGHVKQIVGGTLSETDPGSLKTNFVAKYAMGAAPPLSNLANLV
jgi:hypothetical protein